MLKCAQRVASSVPEAKILTHDNTIREPTKALVPGLTTGRQNRIALSD